MDPDFIRTSDRRRAGIHRVIQTLLLGVLLVAAEPAYAVWTLVQHPTSTQCATQICSLTLTQTTGIGNLIVINAPFTFTVTAPTISSVSGGGTYTIPAACRLVGGGKGTNCAYTLASTATASISVTQSVATPATFLNIREYSSTGTIGFDIIGTNQDNTCIMCVGVALTLTGTNDVIIQNISTGSPGSGASSISSPYGNLDVDANKNGYADALNGVNGAAPTWTDLGTLNVIVIAIAFNDGKPPPCNHALLLLGAGCS